MRKLLAHKQQVHHCSRPEIDPVRMGWRATRRQQAGTHAGVYNEHAGRPDPEPAVRARYHRTGARHLEGQGKAVKGSERSWEGSEKAVKC